MAGIRAENENNYCEHCLELRRTLVKTLGEKRALLLRLQKEQGRIRKLLKEAEKGKKKDGEEQSNSRDVSRLPCESGSGLCMEQQLNEVLKINKKWKEDYEALELRYLAKNETLQTELDLTKEKLATAETQVLALGSEVTRLADSLNDMYTREASSPLSPLVDMESYEIFKQQIELYKEDFSIERRDRERAQCEKDSLQQKLKDAQEVITTLTQEVDLYKEQLDETLEQSRRLRRHSDPPPIHSSCPQLQIIYPVNRPLTPSQRQWRMDQRRQGILTRGANHYTAPSSFYYGGDVEVDDRRI